MSCQIRQNLDGTAVPATLTLNPEADALVFDSANQGGLQILRADSGMDSYLRFNVPAVNGPITAVRLRLYAMDNNGDGFTVHSVADNSWDEMTINSGNAPALGGVIGSYGATTANSWLEIDLTGYVNGGGQVSLGLNSGSSSLLRWRSREHANAPELIIEVNGGGATATPTQTPPPTATPTTGPSPTPTNTPGSGGSVTFAPEADSFTYGAQNNGGQTILRAQGGSQPMTAYLRFNVQNLSGTVTQAVLRLYVMDSNSDGFTVNSVADNSWGEMTLNSSNAPAVGGAIGSYGATTANTGIDVDITGYVTGNGLYSLALTSGTTNTLRWRSREHANAPQLILTTSGGSANSGQTQYVSWSGFSDSSAYPTPTPGGHRPLKRGPSEPRWRPGEGPGLEAGKNSGLSGKPNQNVNAAPAWQTGETVIQRVTYSISAGSMQALAGQRIAVRVTGDPDPANNGLFYIHSDHPSARLRTSLGSTSVLTKYSDGYIRTDSLTRYAPFGAYRQGGRSPITDRAYTGQRENMELGLYYYNAHYYLPGVGRFVSADTLVPDSVNPQNYNRYSYVNNNPLVFIDPSGHCVQNYADSPELLEQCIYGANSIINKLSEMAYGTGGNGADYNDFIRYLIENATIDQIEGIVRAYEIEYGYTWTPYEPPEYDGGSYSNYEWTHAGNSICQYWQSCYDPVGEYGAVSGNLYIGGQLIVDDWGNVYLNVHVATTPGFGTFVGNIQIYDENRGYVNIEDLAVDQQEQVVQEYLTGPSASNCGSMGVTVCGVSNSAGHKAHEVGFSTPGVSGEIGYTWLIYDSRHR